MNDTPEDAWLIALGSAVSDGAAVDWDTLERRATTDQERQVLHEMRGIARIVDAHRSDAIKDADEPPVPLPAPARHWRHIVLFESIGSGAFGTVYRGWDPALDREVAVKLFRSNGAVAASPLEEGRHLARVRHSNVVTVYGADRDGDETGIWMEYIEGQTLARMVSSSGPLSAREVTGVGVDLCRALAALHGAGLLHRDIKAQNVMREVGGRIVLMDFSGAQTITRESGTTITSGTPLYMAPELLERGDATFASDVYSLGVLLFFLLSGRLPVEGHTVADLRRAHAEGRRKRLRDLRPDLPEPIVQVVERAIVPDASRRYQTAGEFEHALVTASGSAVAQTHGETAGAALVKPRRSAWPGVAGIALAGVIIAASAASLVPAGASVPRSLVTHFTIGPPFTSGSWPRVSPDGRFVVFGAIVEGRDRFWVRELGSVGGRPLMNTTASESPFWSPDSTSLCFFADGKLKRIPIDSGDAQPEVLADAPEPHGGDWNGHSILFSRHEGLYVIALDRDGAVSQVTTVDRSAGDYYHTWPEFLPDGRRFLFIIRSTRAERTGVYLGSLDGGTPRLVMPANSRVRYIDGHLLFVRQGILVAQQFNEKTATVEGQPMTLADRLKYHPESDAAFDVSRTGVLVYGQTASAPVTRLMLFDGRGRELEALTEPGYYRQPKFSPDGRRVAAEKISQDDQNVDVWLFDIGRHALTRLTSATAPDERPAWSPDGRRIVFSSKRGALYDVYVKSVDTAEPEQRLIDAPGDKIVENWSADGKYLSGTVLRSGLWIFSFSPNEKPRMVRSDPRTENWQSEFSPDGKWLAYTSSESGSPEVYVEPLPLTGTRWQVSLHGGAEPHWRNGGHEMLYLGADGMLMSVPVTSDGWEKSKPIPLFHISVPDLAGSGDYTVSPDGEHIVVNTFISDPVVPPIDVVVNWPALLKR